MKNVHVLPTDQPSKLLFNSLHKSFSIQKEKDGMYINDGKVTGADFWGYNIYITSSEVIEEDDYCYDNFLKSVFKANSIMGVKTQFTSEKIILSTDPTLISDGVQEIEEDFLKWFVKNPTCEFVLPQKTQHVSYETNYNGRTTPLYKWGYKITIPQEEPKQEILPEFNLSKGVFDKISGLTKQEPKQTEIKYSEQEVLDLLYKRDLYLLNRDETKELELPTEWFEQFKKK